MSKCLGDEVLSEVDSIVNGIQIPNEVNSSSWNHFIVEMVGNEMSESELKRESVKIWQYYTDNWRNSLAPVEGDYARLLYVGSFAEGMTNSQDVDQLLIAKWLKLYEGKSDIGDDRSVINLQFVQSPEDAGYVNIVVPSWKASIFEHHITKRFGRKFYLCNDGYIRSVREWGFIGKNDDQHGPALSALNIDTVHAIQCRKWPRYANDLFKRQKCHVMKRDHLKSLDVYVVPVGYRHSDHKDIEWRTSFTGAEMYLVSTWNDTKRYCYYLLKNFNKTCLPQNDIVCSYFQKTIIFWLSDVLPTEYWCEKHLTGIFLITMNVLCYFLASHNIPHYFIPEHNMIRSRNKDDCETMSGMIRSFLVSGQMDVIIADSLCGERVKTLLELAGENVSTGIRRSHRRFCAIIREFLESDWSFQDQKPYYEVDQLSWFSPHLAVWNKCQCTIVEKILGNLDKLVSAKFVPVFKTLIKRKIADFYHKLRLRSSLRRAEELYIESIPLVYSCGFDDQGVSGLVHLAFFKYLTGEREKSFDYLMSIYPLIQKICATNTIDFYICISLTKSKANRFNSDKLLCDIISTMSRNTPLYINSIVLYFYIIIQSLRSLNKQKIEIMQWFDKFGSFQNMLRKPHSLDSQRLLYAYLRKDLFTEFGDLNDGIS